MSAGWSFGMTWASFNVVQSHSYVLTGLHSPAALVIYMLRCQKTHRLQKIGTIIVTIGAFCMIIDPDAKRVGEQVNIWKSVQALQACIPGALFWECNDYAKARLDLVTKSILQFFVITSYFVITTLLVEDTKIDTSDDGIFGMLRPENWYIAFFWSGLWGGFFGYFAYCVAPEYFSSLVVMNCLLIEPFVSQIFALFLEIDEMPGILTWAGTFIVCISINIIHQGSMKLKAEVSAELDDVEDSPPSSIELEKKGGEGLKLGVSVA
uniref:EamA domain-containing protein n=1 Tax=Strombidium inclinatum TaxID=197538 RepID=A0A7S3N1U4_9SPIT|mmetsp:Transcript_33607/g.51760  ORF Transcript_33607/g.51760 Transcript_33607/m.51760 type:complete len:265 (+) Transcript_33607:518-1312(+)